MHWNFQNSYLQLPESFFSRQKAAPSPSPRLIVGNEGLQKSLGLGDLQEATDVAILAGNAIAPGSDPFAQAYSGHQYGYFTRLGDGRALVLGEHITPDGQRFDIQLKGSGRTPYSRRGDGKAGLGPMLREFLMSEAMHALGIPTTRSLAVMGTGELVYRDSVSPGAVLVRVAASHIRVGTFEYAASLEDRTKLQALADYTIQRHYPELAEQPEKYTELLRSVCRRQAHLVSQWLCVGFVHGVMNTDNMTLSGETIDYGPCAFMNAYDPATVFSSIDQHGRYAYGNQAAIALWNLERLAEALLPLMDADEVTAKEKATSALQSYVSEFHEAWLSGMGRKLGIRNVQDSDLSLIGTFLELLKTHKSDFTNTFRALSSGAQNELFQTAEFQAWNSLWKLRLSEQGETLDETHRRMQENNPAIIPRNHQVEKALAAAQLGELSYFHRLVEAYSHPFQVEDKDRDLEQPPSAAEAEGYKTFCGT